jgi:hypothetical protein
MILFFRQVQQIPSRYAKSLARDAVAENDQKVLPRVETLTRKSESCRLFRYIIDIRKRSAKIAWYVQQWKLQ